MELWSDGNSKMAICKIPWRDIYPAYLSWGIHMAISQLWISTPHKSHVIGAVHPNLHHNTYWKLRIISRYLLEDPKVVMLKVFMVAA
jgi:hypothetical protein